MARYDRKELSDVMWEELYSFRLYTAAVKETNRKKKKMVNFNAKKGRLTLTVRAQSRVMGTDTFFFLSCMSDFYSNTTTFPIQRIKQKKPRHFFSPPLQNIYRLN